MHVCIDIQSAIAQRAGVGRYTKSLVEHLAGAAGSDRLQLFYFDFKRKGVPFPVPDATQRVVRWLPGRVVQKAWKTVAWPPFDWFSGPADVFHFPNFIRPPLTRGRSVVTVHDLSFVKVPETMDERNYQYLSARIRDTVERADAIITDARSIADELVEAFPAARGKTHPIWLGLNHAGQAPDTAAVDRMRQALRIDRPYLLSVGTLEPRKNMGFTVEVFERMDRFDGDLVIAGMRGWKYEPILEKIRTSPKANRIHYIEYVPEELLRPLYAGAELFVFPSLYEGFGFTPLEAMDCGCPVLSSTGGSLAEVLADAATVVQGYEAEAWATAAQSLLEDSGGRAGRIARGRAHVRQFTWQETARQTWSVYRGVAS